MQYKLYIVNYVWRCKVLLLAGSTTVVVLIVRSVQMKYPNQRSGNQTIIMVMGDRKLKVILKMYISTPVFFQIVLQMLTCQMMMRGQKMMTVGRTTR